MAERDVLLVRGAARRTAVPDHAVLHVTVSAAAPTAGDVERSIAADAASIDAALDAHGDAIGARVATSVQVRPNTYWDQKTGRQVRDGFVGDRVLQVRVDDPARTGAIVRGLYESGVDARIDGPAWGLADDHPVHAEVRAAAAADARARAEAYARGLGVGVGSVAVVAEPGLRGPDGGGGPQPVMARMAMRAEADAGGEPIGLPAEVEVTAAVEVGFHLER